MNGNLVKADYVISATDTKELFGSLIDKQYMDANWKNAYSDSCKYPLFSGFQAAFSVDKSSYKGEGTIFFDCKPFKIAERNVTRMSVKSYEYEPDWAPEGKIELLDAWTPLTYERYCNAYNGAYMSFITKKDVKSFLAKGTIKALPNVFIASQWLNAPGGLPVAASSGKFAVQRIVQAEK